MTEGGRTERRTVIREIAGGLFEGGDTAFITDVFDGPPDFGRLLRRVWLQRLPSPRAALLAALCAPAARSGPGR